MSDREPLRLLFDTQSTGLSLFWNLYQALKDQGELGPCGFFTTNAYETAIFEAQNPTFCTSGLSILREGDILNAAQALAEPDLARIAAWEEMYGDPTLWHALIVDRRMGFTLKAQFFQSYEPNYTHDQLLKILQSAIAAVETQFDTIKPHAVIGLNAVTVYDYLYYLIATKRGIPYFQLKLTRIQNFVSLFTEPFALSPHIAEVFERLRSASGKTTEELAVLAGAKAFLTASKEKTLVYEGAIKKPEEQKKAPPPRKSRAAQIMAWTRRLHVALTITDPHYPTLFYSLFQTKVVRPLRRRFLNYPFDIHNAQDFIATTKHPFALYPLNTEPEVALLAFGRPYRNQIETVRNVAAALPVGWKLVVKEHPNAFGYRTVGFYKKLKQIPNVVLASHRAETGALTQACGLLALVYGTIGLEAIIKQKPVILFCETPYAVFPKTMVRYAPDGWQLAQAIRDLLATYHYDETQVEAYIAAHIATSVRANLFTELLGKGGRVKGEGGGSTQDQFRTLATYLRTRIAEEAKRLEPRRAAS